MHKTLHASEYETIYNQNELKDTIRTKDSYDDTSQTDCCVSNNRK